LTRATLFILVAVLMVREPAGAQSLRTSTLGVTSASCASCAVPLTERWRFMPPQADSSGERHLMRVVGLTVAGAAVGAFVGALHGSTRPDCSADICGFRSSAVNQSVLFGALFGTVIGFSTGMLIWGT
jgi:hypothetical protein